MSAFQPLGPNYLVSTDSDYSSLYSLVIDDTNHIGSVWQVTNITTDQQTYVNISTDPFDGGAIVPGFSDPAAPGQGVAIPPATQVYININVTGANVGPVYISAASQGAPANVIVVPGTWV